MLVTQTVGPISIITLLTVITEYKVHISLKARRWLSINVINNIEFYIIYFSLFEAQHRRRSVVLVEEMRERFSHTVAIFIAVKFLILR